MKNRLVKFNMTEMALTLFCLSACLALLILRANTKPEVIRT